MITEMNPILGKLDRVTATIYPADTEGRHRVTLSCKVKDAEGPETKQLEGFAPLSLFGTPEELDEKLGGVVANWAGCLSTSFDNLKEIDEQAKAIEQAAKAKKKPPAKRAKAKTKAQLADEEDAKRLADLECGGSRLSTETKTTKEPDLLAGLV